MDVSYVFGEWLPDLPKLNNPGVTVARNVLPAANGYQPMRSLAAYSPPLDSLCLGAYSALSKDGTSYTYAGTATKLYQISATVAADVTRTSGAYSTAPGDYWEFAQFGEIVIATNHTDDVQAVTFGGANFAALGGSPPKAKHVATVRDFVVLGNIGDAVDGLVPNRVHWSGFNNATSWVAGIDQSDRQDLFGRGGRVQRVIGGEYGIVLQENSIWRMTYEGPPTVFRFDEIEPGRGTPAPGSVAQLGNTIFYLGQDGFYAFNGIESVPIGASRVDRSFFAEVDTANLHRMSVAVDPLSKLVFWAYPTGDGVGNGVPDKLLAYDWSNNKWSQVEVDIERIVQALSTGYTLEGLDSISPSLNALSASLDSSLWTGGSLLLAAFDVGHRFATFTGANLTATIETPEAQLTQGGSSYVSAVRPLADGPATIQLGSRDRPDEAVSFSPAMPVNNIGEADFHDVSRYHQVRVSLSGSWTEAQGLDITFEAAGAR